MRSNIALFLILLTTAYARCRPTFELTNTFCSNVPTTKVDSHAFQGTWFQIFLTTGTSTAELNSCATINYTLSDGISNVLNCEFDDFLSRPRCFINTVTRKPDGGPGSFILTFGPRNAPFDIVALQGSKSYGYAAAAAFVCNPGVPRVPGFFILSRTPFLQRNILHRFKKRLKCLGFPLPPPDDFVLTRVRRCKYFFNKDGFDVLDPQDFVNPM